MDNATYFTNENLKNWLLKSNVTPCYTSIRHPCANQTERYIREIIKCLRLITHDQHECWERNLKRVEYSMNNVPHDVTNKAPVLVMRNIVAERPWILENTAEYDKIITETKLKLEKNAEKYEQRKIKRIKKRTIFKQDELVIIKALRVPNRKKNKCAKLQLI